MYPSKKVILAAYSDSFAEDWGRAVRDELQSNPYITVGLAQDSTSAKRFNTTLGGGMITAGIGSPITGRGASLLLIDDPLKNWQEAMSETTREHQKNWFQSTLYTRGEPGATIIVLQTRWHEDDLAGWLQTQHSDKWDVIRFPAVAEDLDVLGRKRGDPLCPERYDVSALNRLKEATGPIIWSALYQQSPTTQGGGMFREEMFEFGQIPKQIDWSFVTADTSYREKEESDYTVFSAWGVTGEQLYLMDVWRRQIKASEVEGLISPFIKRFLGYGYRGTYIEPKGHGIYLNQSLAQKGLMIPGETTIQEFYKDRRHDKSERANNVLPHLANRKVIFNKDMANKEELLNETLGFPKMKHDDFVDTLVDALKLVYARQIGLLDVL
jgi:predicted phage terminase large subunit-like protein